LKLRLPRLRLHSYIWNGTLKLPKGIKIKDYRLAIREYEIFDTDEVDKTTRTTALVAKKYKRLVYAETH
jgi:L-rhamnose mutarotase